MINPYDKQPEEVKTEEVQATADKQDALPDLEELDRLNVARYFGMDRVSDIEKHTQQLQRLIDWARADGATSRDEIGAKIVGLKNRVGGSMYDVATFAYLELERGKIDKQIKEMEGNGRISR